jgi:hypothetical protein
MKIITLQTMLRGIKYFRYKIIKRRGIITCLCILAVLIMESCLTIKGVGPFNLSNEEIPF